MKKKKLKLDELKVESFVTEDLNGSAETLKGGGIDFSAVDGCRSALIQCDPITAGGCGGTTIFNTKVCSWNDGCGSALGCHTTTKLTDTKLTTTGGTF